MKSAMHFLQARLIDMGVNLRRGQAGVAQHLLDCPQIGTVAQEVRGE